MEGRVTIDPTDPGALQRSLSAWERAGASHVSINTMRLGFVDVDAHLDALQRAAYAIGLSR
jgi:hypothetical protein